jgi:hypothetical protein
VHALHFSEYLFNIAALSSFESLAALNGGTPPHPTQPPVVTSIRFTLYRVDVQPALPALTRDLAVNAALLIGYCTIVIKVVGGDDCPPKYYVLVSCI